jgi:hypothetical protein
MCAFDGCTKKGNRRGLCPGHYRQQRLGQELRPLRIKRHLHKDKDGRVCTKCDEYKPWSEFYWHKSNSGHYACCKECAKKYDREKHHSNV